jgi:hypothetical protein
MKELSLNILDVSQNSISAGATALDITVTSSGDGILTITVADNGCGMSPEFLARCTDPFTTTRSTRRVGLGLPLLRLAAEQAGGNLDINSQLGKGTVVTARFREDHIDCPPLGDLAGTISILIQGAPDTLEIVYTHRTPAGMFRLDTRELRKILGRDIPLSSPEVSAWIRDYLAEGEQITMMSTPKTDEKD